MRLRLDLSYAGTDFHGWATQPGLRTVQGTLESALATVLRTSSASVVCAGRTDTGVHARGQVAHLDLPADSAYDERLMRRLNGILPPDLRVRAVGVAPAGFDARFSALWRRYAYRVTDAVADPLTRGHVLAHPRPLDVAAMDEAGRSLTGLHDFAAFCKPREGATTIRTLLECSWSREGAVLTGLVRADAFCHHMVRSLVGCLLQVGEGKRTPDFARSLLDSGRRDPGVSVVAAHGLTLEEVAYPADDELAAQGERARAKRSLP